jgi:hypothetical protein
MQCFRRTVSVPPMSDEDIVRIFCIVKLAEVTHSYHLISLLRGGGYTVQNHVNSLCQFHKFINCILPKYRC